MAISDKSGFSSGSLIIVLSAAAAVMTTCLVAVSEISFESKTAGFAAITLLFACASAVVAIIEFRRSAADERDIVSDQALAALSDAHEFFGGTIALSDAFRLVASKFGEVIPAVGALFYQQDEQRARFIATHASGIGADLIASAPNCLFPPGQLLSSFTDHEGESYVTVSLPFSRNGDVFAGLTLFCVNGTQVRNSQEAFLRAGIERAAPLFLSAISNERSRQSALTDVATNLPNERAFYLVLENQIAETQRNSGERPLAVMTVDVENLGDIQAGTYTDEALRCVADLIKDSLRQMDFLACATDGEFLIVLPTATSAVGKEVAERIETASCLVERGAEEFTPVLNFGIASFGVDGETAKAILSTARFRREQAKAPLSANIISFSKELVN